MRPRRRPTTVSSTAPLDARVLLQPTTSSEPIDWTDVPVRRTSAPQNRRRWRSRSVALLPGELSIEEPIEVILLPQRTPSSLEYLHSRGARPRAQMESTTFDEQTLLPFAVYFRPLPTLSELQGSCAVEFRNPARATTCQCTADPTPSIVRRGLRCGP